MTTAYKQWTCETAGGDEVRLDVGALPECCRKEAQQTTSFEAAFDCPVCATEWRAA